MVTFQLTVEQFQLLLNAVLATDAPDELTNLVLMACTRPHDGVISVPVPSDDAAALATVVRAKAAADPTLQALADLMATQIATSAPDKS